MEMNHDEATLHQLERDLDTKIYPGTEIMADFGSYHFVKSSADSDRVLVPQPSADLHDPLNWSPRWKTTAISLSTAVSFAQGFGALAVAPMFPQLMEAFDRSLADVVQFTGVCILVLGFSNFLWVPVQTAFGRRPVLILSELICLVSMIWRARATDYRSFLGACALNGIGAGPGETSQPTIIADVMFLHERGAYNTLYWTFYFGSLTIGSVIAGVMALHSSWRNFWWLNVAIHGVVLILVIFQFPETKWHRVRPTELSKQTVRAGDEKGAAIVSLPSESDNSVAKGPDSVMQVATATKQSDQRLYFRKGKPSKHQFQLWQLSPSPFQDFVQAFWTPWKIFAFPIVEFAAFVVSWSASTMLTVILTQSQNFAAPPYNFSSQAVGFTNFGFLVGAGIGLATNGPLSDWIAARLTKKNRGIREPEMRLPALIPFVVIMLVSNFVLAFGYQYKWDWKVIIIIGYAGAGIVSIAIPAIACTYAVDSYKPIAGSIFVSITVNKNLWGYGYSKFITPWIISDGYVPPIVTNMCLTFLICSLAIPFWFFGKTFRKWTRNSSVHKL